MLTLFKNKIKYLEIVKKRLTFGQVASFDCLDYNRFYHSHRLLIIYRKIKDYDSEMEVCEKILSEYKKIIQKEGNEDYLNEDYDEKFIKKYKNSKLKELKIRLKTLKLSYDKWKQNIKRCKENINDIKEELEKFDETKDDIRIKNSLSNQLFNYESFLSIRGEEGEMLRSQIDDLEKIIEDSDKNFVFKKEEIVFPREVTEYKKYQKRLERIKQLKEKSK